MVIDMTSIGMNLTSVNYWATQAPFIDRFKTSAEWDLRTSSNGQSTGRDAPLDSKGEVISLDPGYELSTSFAVDPISAGNVNQYVFTYSGTGTFRFNGANVISSEPGKIVLEPTRQDAAPAIYVVLKSTDASDPVHDIHAVRADQVSLFESGEIFNPEFVDKSDEWSVLRFMDWGNTNGSEQISWDTRATLDDASWASQSNADGVPIEIKVALANEAGTDMWFNIPTMADDTYVTNALTYIRDNLNPALKVHVEYSNEVWNWGFVAAKYAQQQGNAMWGTDHNGDGQINASDSREAVQGSWMMYYGYRSAQIADIARDVFGDQADARLETVLANQTGYSALFNYIDQGVERAGVGSTADLFDEYAITTYFGHEVSMAYSNAADRATVLNWARSGEEGMAAAFHEIEHGGALSTDLSMNILSTQLANQSAIASDNGMTLVAYEGGAHLTPMGFSGDDQALMIDFIGRLMNDPRMGDLYTKMVDMFDDAGGETLVAFADAGTNSRSGYWGTLDNIYQDSSERYDALLQAQHAYELEYALNGGLVGDVVGGVVGGVGDVVGDVVGTVGGTVSGVVGGVGGLLSGLTALGSRASADEGSNIATLVTPSYEPMYDNGYYA
jgi:hypothetical protein